MQNQKISHEDPLDIFVCWRRGSYEFIKFEFFREGNPDRSYLQVQLMNKNGDVCTQVKYWICHIWEVWVIWGFLDFYSVFCHHSSSLHWWQGRLNCGLATTNYTHSPLAEDTLLHVIKCTCTSWNNSPGVYKWNGIKSSVHYVTEIKDNKKVKKSSCDEVSHRLHGLDAACFLWDASCNGNNDSLRAVKVKYRWLPRVD